MRCWCGYLSGARCRLSAHGPADATAISKPRHLLPHLNPDCMVLPFWYRLTQVVLEKIPLNGCSSSSSRSEPARHGVLLQKSCGLCVCLCVSKFVSNWDLTLFLQRQSHRNATAAPDNVRHCLKRHVYRFVWNSWNCCDALVMNSSTFVDDSLFFLLAVTLSTIYFIS